MSSKYTGGCRCGSVRYEIDAEPQHAAICHCRDCQYSSGSAFSAIAYFPAAAMKSQGETRGYVVKGTAGLSIERHFCTTCGSPVFSKALELPDLLLVKLSSLDDPNAITPTVHFWTDSMLKWLHIADDLPRLPGNPRM